VGSKKPCFFSENKEIFEKFKHKIIHVIVDNMPDGEDAWKRENYQRDIGIPVGIGRVPNTTNDDIVIVSDLDEIPNPYTIRHLKENDSVGFRRLAQDLYYFEPSSEKYQSRWTHALVADVGSVKTCESLSRERVYGSHDIIENGGWHFSYFLPKELIMNKIKTFAHQENAIQSFAREDHIEQAMKGITGMFGRPVSGGNPSFSLPPGTKELMKRIYELAPLVSDHTRKNRETLE
jgi:beta-1,4-mannosyl-glycoprotein beta-1,4-N-acetylglucosaminyltransferase